MKPMTIGKKYGVGKIAPIQCVTDDALGCLQIRNHCFMLLILREGSAYFQMGETCFEAVAPCFVCFDERQEQAEPSLTRIQEPRLKSAVIFIESHYPEAMTLQDIARAASLNHSSLTQLFKAELGVTPVEYLWRYRIRVARKHMEFTNIPVKEVSVRCGFKTVQHFCRKFEEYVGMSPMAFREETLFRRKNEL